jgi:hypothetical protein
MQLLLADKTGIMIGVLGTSVGMIGSTFGHSPTSWAVIALSAVLAMVGIVKIQENGPKASYSANMPWYVMAAAPSMLIAVPYRPFSGVILVGYILMAHIYNTSHWDWSTDWTRTESAHATYLFFVAIGLILVIMPKID